MQRRTFVGVAALAALFSPFSPGAEPAAPLRFFWVDEDTQIFCAPDIAAINRYLHRGCTCCVYEEALSAFEEPALTEANRGEVWDYASENEPIADEDRVMKPASAWAAELAGVPWFETGGRVCQLSTCYN